MPVPAVDHRSWSPDARAEVISELSGLLGAVQAELGSVITAADVAGDWKADGATGMAASLVARCAITTPHAREWVRVGAALAGLPALRAGLATGALSWDQVRAATRFATPETDAELAERVRGLSAGQVEALARQHRPKDDGQANEAHERRELRWRHDHEAGGFRYRGFLPADMAAAVNEMITALADKAGPDPVTGLWDPFATRCADALHHLATGERADAVVVLHVDAEVVEGATEGNGLLDPLSVGRSTVLRYLCDSALEHTVETAEGTAVGIGRRSQAIPRWLRRHVTHRDRTCRFPGCERPIRHVHHVRHWAAHGGPTDSPNLAGLCWSHHRLVHEGGWSVTGTADGELIFISPTGRRTTSRRQPIRPHTRTRAAALTGTTAPTDAVRSIDGRPPDDRPDEVDLVEASATGPAWCRPSVDVSPHPGTSSPTSPRGP